MNIILFKKEELRGDRVELSDHRAKHIVKVLQSDDGDRVRVGEVGGDIGTGQIIRIKKKFPFIVELIVTLSEYPLSPPPIDLILALPRPIMLKRILSQVTALGVGKISVINTGRVEKSFWDSGILQQKQYRPYLIQGLEQAIDTRVPGFSVFHSFNSYVEEQLSNSVHGYDKMLVAHPGGKQSLAKGMQNCKGRIVYAIGPEGGWLDHEINKFEKAGMQIFSMGPRILKVDTAVVSVHSRIMQELAG